MTLKDDVVSTLDSFLGGLPDDARDKVLGSVEFSLTVNLGGYQSVKLSLKVVDFPLASKSFELAYSEIVAKTRKLLRESGYPVEAAPKGDRT